MATASGGGSTFNRILVDVPMPIFTPRLMIRPPQAGDGKVMNAAIRESVVELKPWMPWVRKSVPTIEESEEVCRQAQAKFVLRDDMTMFCFDRVSGEFIGSTGLHRFNLEHGIFEIGYWIRSSRSGKGYVTEATNALTRFCFGALGARRVQLFCNASNLKSVAIPESLGFEKEGRLREYDSYAASEVPSRDTLLFARISLDGLPALDVSW